MQIFANGLISGLTTAVLAVAFSVVYVPTRIFHIALGGIYVAASFFAWAVLEATGSVALSIVVAIGGSVLLSVGCEALNHAQLERKGAPMGAHLIASLGLYIIFVQAIALTWGNETKSLRLGVDTTMSAGGVILTSAQVLGAVVSSIVLAGFFLWLKFSDLGLQFRALADNAKELSLRGFNVRRLRLAAFGVSGALAAVSSLLTSYDLGFDPHVGLPALLLAVVAVIIGGRLSFFGPVVGALLLGIVRSEVVWFLSAQWQEAVTFFVLVVFLYVRPNGLIGRSMRLEADA